MNILHRLASLLMAVTTLSAISYAQAQLKPLSDTVTPSSSKIAPNKFAIGEFKRLQIDGHMDVVLKQGTESFVEFEGKEFDTRESSGLKF